MLAKTKFDLKPGMATREAFGRTLAALGKENPDIVVCDADLSKSTYTSYFAKEFPDRFFECGIAEANMVSIGAGLILGHEPDLRCGALAAGRIPLALAFGHAALAIFEAGFGLAALFSFPDHKC